MTSIRLLTIVLAAAIIPTFPASAQFSVTTPSPAAGVATVAPDKSSGLETVFVIENTNGVRLNYRSTSENVIWKRFSNLGGGYAEDISGVSVDGNITSITPSNSDMGYIVEDGGRQTACWLVNYANHEPTLTAITISPESDCDRVFITPTGTIDRINYYTVNGRPVELDRGISVEYPDLEVSSDRDRWNDIVAKHNYPSVASTISLTAPLRDGVFTLKGDRFLEEWGRPIVLSTANYTATRVSAITSASQSERNNDNESGAADGSLGGSAPCEITFRAIPSDAAVFREWQFSDTESFDDFTNRYNEEVVEHTFTEYGTTYVRFVAADASGNCTYKSDVYTIAVGESKLECPNAFSPLNQDGVNDEWKVSYSSLVSFECHIFNRWGQKIFSTDNPAEGWDGRHGGKLVKPGVFFYVIKARGSDGKLYNLSGDINIIGSRLNPTGNSSAE